MSDRTTLTADATNLTADTTRLTADRTVVSTVDKYVARITPWQSNRARFVATVRASLQPLVDARAVMSSLPSAFDIDFATGLQLDAVGQWVGRARVVPTPLPKTFFTLGSARLGFGQGYWKSRFDSLAGLSSLPDSLYRRLLRAKALANIWDGTSTSLLTILQTYFTQQATRVIIDDAAPAIQPVAFFALGDPDHGFGAGIWRGPDVSPPATAGYGLTIGVSGLIPLQIDLSILASELIPVQAAGSNVAVRVTTVNGAPVFGFGADSGFIGGFGRGAWGAPPATVADTLAD